MSKARNTKAKTRRTNRDCSPPRPYRLSPEGLSSLHRSALATMPWRRSTGPRTAAGKARSSLNALKHGERSAGSVAARREANAALWLMREEGRLERDAAAADAIALQQDWIDRIAVELRLGEP